MQTKSLISSPISNTHFSRSNDDVLPISSLFPATEFMSYILQTHEWEYKKLILLPGWLIHTAGGTKSRNSPCGIASTFLFPPVRPTWTTGRHPLATDYIVKMQCLVKNLYCITFDSCAIPKNKISFFVSKPKLDSLGCWQIKFMSFRKMWYFRQNIVIFCNLWVIFEWRLFKKVYSHYS